MKHKLLQKSASLAALIIGIAVAVTGVAAPASALTTSNPNYITRLAPNGYLDPQFATTAPNGFDGAVLTMVTQSNGDLVVGGYFSSFTGYTFDGTTTSTGTSTVSVSYIARLTPTGALDTTFMGAGAGFDDAVRGLAIDGSGNIIAVGDFKNFTDNSGNTNTPDYIARLTAAGTFDASFVGDTGGFSNATDAVAIDGGGNIIVGGEFISFTDNATNSTPVKRIVRLTPSGAVDTTFVYGSSHGFDERVMAIAIDGSGNIIAGGWFSNFTDNNGNLSYSLSIARLSPTGVLDTSFTGNNHGFDGNVLALAIDASGNIVVGGGFSQFSSVANVVSDVNNIARLTPAGVLDTTFVSGSNTGFDDDVYALAIDADGNVVVGGSFAEFTSSGGTTTTVNKIALLTPAGEIDTTFTSGPNTGFDNDVQGLAIDSHGYILVGGDFTSYASDAEPYVPPTDDSDDDSSLAQTGLNALPLGVSAVALLSIGGLGMMLRRRKAGASIDT
ncbi:MAG: hypothetical protein ACOYBP_00570 [Microbacteriaceae bacterium]